MQVKVCFTGFNNYRFACPILHKSSLMLMKMGFGSAIFATLNILSHICTFLRNAWYIWYHILIVGYPLDGVVSIFQYTSGWKLYIPKVAKADKGFYTCKITNTHGSINFTVELDVIGENDHSCSSYFYTKLENIQRRSNDEKLELPFCDILSYDSV